MSALRSIAGFILLGVALLALLAPSWSRAQFVLPGIENSLSIFLSPPHPGPGDAVRVEARSSAYDLSEIRLTWRVDGKTVAQGFGAEIPVMTAGKLGEEIAVSVEGQTPDGANLFAEASIIPTSIDLLVDADSYVPPFYRGRALPSAGTNVRLEAIPHFVRAGKEIAAGDLTYTWRRNDTVIASVSGRGKSSVSIAAPVLFGADVISVEARSSDGALNGEASAALSSANPVLALYENHPLYGILYHRALASGSAIADSEMTFTAAPYFAPVKRADDRLLEYRWKVNDEAVVADAARPGEITVSSPSANGTANLFLEIAHASNPFFRAVGEWAVVLAAQDGFSGQFRNPGQ